VYYVADEVWPVYQIWQEEYLIDEDVREMTHMSDDSTPAIHQPLLYSLYLPLYEE
jgi:hypothetical protein